MNYDIKKCNLISLTLLSACGTFFMRYNEAIFDTMEEHIHDLFAETYPDHATLDLLIVLITTGLTVGAILGALLSGIMTNSLGRKNTLLIFDMIAIIGTVLTIMESPILIVVGRVFTGFCLGGFTSVSRLFMIEMSPITLRPRCMAIIEILEMFGVQLAYLLGFGFYSNTIGNSEYWWRLMFGLNIPLCLTHLLVTLFIYNIDTPLFTYVKTADEELTKNVLNKIYVNENDVDVLYRELDKVSYDKLEQNKISFCDLFIIPKYRKRSLIGFAIAIGSVFVGSDALIFYSNTIFLSYTSSQTSTIYTNVIGFAQLVASFIAVSFVEHMGRRKLFLIGYSGLLFLLVSLGLFFMFEIHGPIFYFLCGIIILNVTTVGPVTHLYLAEILPEKGLALGYSFYYASKVILTMTFKPIVNSGLDFSGLFFVYAGTTFISLCFVFCKVKETCGKTIGQLEALY